MDHRLKASRRWAQRIGCIGVIGAGLGACSSMLGAATSLYLSYELYEKYRELEEQDEVIHLALETIDTQERVMELYKEVQELQEEGLKNHFKEIKTGSWFSRLQDKEKKDLSDLLTLTLSPEDARNNARENLCYMYHNWKDDRKDEGSSVSFGGTGNCVFLTDTLVLTVLHMTDDPYDYLFYRTADTIVSITRPDLFDSFHVKDVVAISPRYDLAVLRVEEHLGNVKPVPIRTAVGESFSYFSISSDHGENKDEKVKYQVKEQPFTLVRKSDIYAMTQEGSLTFPSLEMDTPIRHGYSGSPIFDQNWNLIGLISKGRFGENEIQSKNAIVSDQVYAFLNCLVDQPLCKGWENTAQIQQ